MLLHIYIYICIYMFIFIYTYIYIYLQLDKTIKYLAVQVYLHHKNSKAPIFNQLRHIGFFLKPVAFARLKSHRLAIYFVVTTHETHDSVDMTGHSGFLEGNFPEKNSFPPPIQPTIRRRIASLTMLSSHPVRSTMAFDMDPLGSLISVDGRHPAIR